LTVSRHFFEQYFWFDRFGSNSALQCGQVIRFPFTIDI